MRSLLAAAVVAILGAAALALPVRWARKPAAISPRDAAARAEAEVPGIGVVWGKLRGWERHEDGWLLLWQPAHGAWTVLVSVPDRGGPVPYHLSVAPWLPGARLSREAAGRLVGAGGDEEGVPRERVGRRDWRFGTRVLAGAVAAGAVLGFPRAPAADHWLAVVVGLVLGGAVVRRVLPTLPSAPWRRVTIAAAMTVIAALPALLPLAVRGYQVGVRPWVAGLAVVSASVLVLGAVMVGAFHYPVMSLATPPWWVGACALVLGVFLAVIRPMPLAAELAGCPLALLVLPAVALLLGWGTCLAADGLREVTALARGARRLVLALLAAAAVATPTSAAPLVVGGCAVASGARGEGAWLATAVAWGWVTGSTLSTCAWPAAVWPAAALLLGAWVVVAARAVARGERGGESPA